MRAQLDETFKTNLAERRALEWTRTGPTTARADIDLGRAGTIAVVDLRERIERGQTISKYRVDYAAGSEWLTAFRGTTIGYRRLTRLPAAITARRLRVVFEEAVAKPEPNEVKLW
jgi:alpha-L-fucosidase